MRIFLICLLLSLSALAQNVPNAPSFKAPLKDPFFWAGTLFHTSSVLADVAHSQSCQRDHTCYEVNPGADQYKNRIPELALFAAADYGCSLALTNHKRFRMLCMLAPVTIGVLHWRDATHIYQR